MTNGAACRIDEATESGIVTSAVIKPMAPSISDRFRARTAGWKNTREKTAIPCARQIKAKPKAVPSPITMINWAVGNDPPTALMKASDTANSAIDAIISAMARRFSMLWP